MAQRLVRRVCQYCKKEMTIPKDLEDDVMASINELAKTSLPKDVSLVSPLKFWQGQGCVRCENTGYKGRVSISEVLAVDEGIKKIIVAGGDLIENMKTAFVSQGMYLMKQDGIFKSLEGQTTIEEVLDATRA
jgi:type IV pilus assembly protein PilB